MRRGIKSRNKTEPGKLLVASACVTISAAAAVIAILLAVSLVLHLCEGHVRYGICRYLYHAHRGLSDARNEYGLADRFCGGLG